MTIKKAVGLMLLAAALFGLAIVGGGCGETVYDEISYFDPNWTPEGNIYARMVVSHYKNEWQGLFFGGQKTIKTGEDTYYATMDTNGTHQSILPYSYYPYFSPKGTYVCYVDNTSTFHIVRRSDNTQVYSFQPTTQAIAELDWGPEEDKLVYREEILTYTPFNSVIPLFSVNIDGSNKVEISGIHAAEPTWKYSTKIAFLNAINGYYCLAFTGADGLNIETTTLSSESIGAYPQYYSDGNYIFTSNSTSFLKIDVLNKTIINTITHGLSGQLSPKTWTNPKLSPDNNQVCGGIYLNEYDKSGIWIISIDGSGYKEIK
ncbi:hypothetical protein A3K48_03755 [candidate division WOR-1 bacterium RIFOXYA12_FULL_52_29]|uniref:Dipeptidylpeptidase IV N-terminal domain-containing protein n=1 Tax=candidate division WOR-1 bacterium RIFOXYC12_FULL_54_18 TaxID=1802584 RepID=A0A1F4T5Q6_UNCSA|nr:MAG: hypothetical protein A3K44_03755 [candidate division WOR-1 bacterium RIFOXYA2_FULL_51_19]OGC17675.1 MAG: hypothetical protein A3K48_03755 [candidate division WOR-1 bacterium RIFOXYA12_FULL_52_29]OGC26532.1 MAG: hypothetical protein A3K32_03750 [candidate division WOR-1 bacterium RIFOXYB2_FULL_45_9]OGC28092.1 MAG: hypothetical protein A3K49_03755 [candidate division WOR-1 bacterium RIFOXYC12_FULL_54_18]OGC29622.1 MAG: hypothetical protein A2346_02580 [candidate division WOR-1 bacterium R